MILKRLFLSKKLSLLFLCLFSPLFVAAQSEITGTVISADDQQPLIGASVSIKGTNVGVTTNAEGAFTLNAESSDVLVASYLGYEPKEIEVGDQSSLIISLEPSVSSLNEVVVTGYTTQRKKDVTGAVSVINVENLTKQPVGQVTNQLQGQASGVNIISSGQPGEDPLITIRGFNTFGNNAPLFVVDGVPTQDINSLNPGDISSIQVLKDAGSASIYGSRASNGVLIITTKKGSGKVKVQYDAYYGTQRPKEGNVWNILNPQEMANLKWMVLRNGGATTFNDPMYGSGETPVLPDYIMPVGAMEGDPAVDPSLYNIDPNYTSTSELNNFYRIVRANKAGTDWYHAIFEPAPIHNQNISVSGGGPQGNYLLSLNYLDQQGTLINTYLKRYTLRVNTEFNIAKGIRVGENLAYSSAQNLLSGTNSEGSAIGMAFREQPIIPIYDIMGNYGGAFTTGGQLLGNAQNPVARQHRTRNNRNVLDRLFGNVYGEVDLLNDFTFRSSFGGERSNYFARSFTYPAYENPENGTTNAYSENFENAFNWTWTNTLTFSKEFRDHQFNALIGTEAYNEKINNLNASNQDYFTFDPNFTTLSTGQASPTVTSGRSEYALLSYFGRLDYVFKDKYLLGATLRRDGSSKFLNNTWGWFPAASLGWRISDESFMKDISWLSDLKLRGSWGIMGNQFNVTVLNSFYTFTGSRGSTYYDITGGNSNLASGYTQSSIGNPDAKWEGDLNANVGIDASLLNGRIQVTADYYRKDIKDLLYNPALPGTAGESTVPFINIASMKNSGFDASLTGIFDIGDELDISTTATLTTYHNEVTKVSGISDYFTSAPKRFGIDIIRNQVGHPVSSFYGYQIEGFWDDQSEIDEANAIAQQSTDNPNAVFQNDVRVGHFRYADVNEDGRVTDADRTFLGSPNPNFSYGLNVGLNYKNFDFSIFFYGTQGNKIWNQTKWWTDFYPTLGPGAKSHTALYESWTPENKDAKVAIQESVASFGTSTVPNSYYVEDGSYLRVKNAQLGYTLPTELLSIIKTEKLRIYVQAANFLTFTKYSGIDPEITGASTSFGIDEGGYAQPRQYIVGLSLQF